MKPPSLHITRILSSCLVVILGLSSCLDFVGATTTDYSQNAVSYVNTYIMNMEQSGYSKSEILATLVSLRDVYSKRQQNAILSGDSSGESTAIILELDRAISRYSGGTSTNYNNTYPQNNNYQNCCSQPQRRYQPPMRYQEYNYQYPRYQYQPYVPPMQTQTVRLSSVYLSSDAPASTETRTNLTRDNSSNSYKNYDLFTFVLQGNGYTNNEPNSSQFLTTSLSKTLTTQQGRTIRVSFGTKYGASQVQTIRYAAQNAYKTSQTVISLAPSFADSFLSLSRDEFYGQAVSNGRNKVYKMYKLYIAQDNSQAFIVEYNETGPIIPPYIYTQNIKGIDTNSFVDYGAYFTHTYFTENNTKTYKQYIYVPQPGSDISTVFSNLGINTRMTYDVGTSHSMKMGDGSVLTYVNGYKVNSGYVGIVESAFSIYGNRYSNPTYVTLPGSSSLFNFSPITDWSFQNVQLADGTYRMYRLFVAIDGSEAYLTEYVENNPYDILIAM